jgi:hypothetical protein
VTISRWFNLPGGNGFKKFAQCPAFDVGSFEGRNPDVLKLSLVCELKVMLGSISRGFFQLTPTAIPLQLQFGRHPDIRIGNRLLHTIDYTRRLIFYNMLNAGSPGAT